MEKIKLIRSKLWKEPRIVIAIMKNAFILDPTVMFGNPVIYALVKKNSPLAFVALKKHGRITELKSVYTFPAYRNKGYMRKLITLVLREHSFLYLLCKKRFVPLYSRFGFQETVNAPWFLQVEKHLFNFFAYFGNTCVLVLKRNR